MLTLLRIAYRNTKRQKKRSLLLGGAVAFGIMVITLINAFTAGMVDNVKSNFSYIIGGHIYISGTELTGSGRLVNAVTDDESAMYALSKVETYIKQVNRRSQAISELIFGSRTAVQTITGISWAAESDLAGKLMIIEGSLEERLTDRQAIVLPKLIAEKLGVVAGETVLARISTVTGQQNVGEFRVIAIIEDQTSFGVTAAYADLSYINELLGLEPQAYQMLHLFLTEMNDMDHVADIIYDALAERAEVEPRLQLGINTGGGEADDRREEEQERQMYKLIFGGQLDEDMEPWEGTKFSVTTLNDIMAPVMSMVGVLNTVSLVVFLILLIITMVGIMNTFRMVLIERTQEIGTMRAFGMQRNTVRNIFVTEAAFIGLGGALAGIAVAGLAMIVLSAIEFTNQSVLQFFLDTGHLTFHLIPANIVVNLSLVMITTLSAAYLPARAAARLRPADALRRQY